MSTDFLSHQQNGTRYFMILCCGEALIDMIATNKGDNQRVFVPHAGGSVFNTAIALGRLKVPVGLLSGVSCDMFGELLVAEMSASAVDVSALIRTERPTTLAFVELTQGQAKYAFFDENSAGRLLTRQDMPDAVSGYQAGYFGGISLACEPCADAYADLAQRLAPDHVIVLDPNIRPMFIVDERRYRARLERLIALADIVKLSDEDLEWLVPGSDDPEARLAHLRAFGAKAVVLTKGAAGAMVVWGDQRMQVAGQPVSVVDTVGAGDTFNAGVLAKLHALGVLHKAALGEITPGQWQAALELGARVAAITVSRSGANPPWLRELG